MPKHKPGIFVGGVPIAECTQEQQAQAALSIDRRMRGLLKEGAPLTHQAPVDIRQLVLDLDPQLKCS
jgi:hypothetical protein